MVADYEADMISLERVGVKMVAWCNELKPTSLTKKTVGHAELCSNMTGLHQIDVQ